MRRAVVHPKLARQIATHIFALVWDKDPQQYQQVQPGVFTDGDLGLVVTGAAQVSEPAANALRLTNRLWELIVVMRPDEPALIYGPRHLYEEDEWGAMVGRAVALTMDVQCVLTTFEVMPVRDMQERADIGVVSAVVAKAFPTDTEPDPELVTELLRQIDLEVAA